MTECVLYETIDQVPLDQWNEVCQVSGSSFMARTFCELWNGRSRTRHERFTP